MIDLSFLNYLTFSRVRVTFQACDRILLPAFKFSTFRGSLGSALFSKFCKFQFENCIETCSEKFDCIYSQLYNSYQNSHTKYHKSPHPYIITPIHNLSTVIDPGQTFSFELTLIGKATTFFSALMPAFFVMGNTGIGENKGKFIPVEIKALTANGSYRKIAFNAVPPTLFFNRLPLPNPGNKVILLFETPLKLENENGDLLKENEPPSFFLFVKRLAHRLALLSCFHCNSPWDVDVSPVTGMPDVKIVDQKLLSESDPSYSRNQKDIFLKGLTGKIVYQGDIKHWLPLLFAGSWLHAGLNTTFGFGKYTMKIVDT